MDDAAAPVAEGDLRRDADAMLLTIAYARMRMVLWLTAGAIAIFIGLLWPLFDSARLLTWVAALALVTCARFVLYGAFRRARPTAEGMRLWWWLFLVFAVMSGLSWAYGPMVLMSGGAAESILLVLTLLAVTAVSSAALAPHQVAMQCFQIAALMPTVILLYTSGGEIEKVGAAILFAGMVSMVVVGRASSVTIRSLLETEMRLARAVNATEAARGRAEAASHAKTRFLANMSHELRTPLNAVIGAAQLVQAGEHDPARRAQLLDAIQRSGTNLLGLIEDVLDLSRIEAGELRLYAADFHLFDCVDSALATARLSASAKGLSLSFFADQGLVPWRNGDAARLRQILINLLGNAVKFTESGEIVVRLGAGRGTDGVHLTIQDTGIGIPADVIAHVFEPFRQGDESSGRRFGGSGLGLAIVHELVAAMGGTVAVRSKPGKGTLFDLELPLTIAPVQPVADQGSTQSRTDRGAAHPPAADPGPAVAPIEGPRILVVEDDPLNQLIVGRLLEHAGCRVRVAADGPTALSVLAQEAFDLVLMDWHMPDMDGLEVTRRIRQGQAGDAVRALPIVALTANSFAEDRASCLDAGMNDFLTKPVQAGALAAAIARWVPAYAAVPQADRSGLPRIS